MGKLERVHGLTKGIKEEHRRALETLQGFTVPSTVICTPELAGEIAHLSHAIGREVGVLVDRHGHVREIVIGRRWKPWLEEIPPRTGSQPLAGLRLIEAHPTRDGRPTEADRRLLFDAGLDLLVTLGSTGGSPTEAWIATLAASNGRLTVHEEGPYTLDTLAHLDLAYRLRSAEEALRSTLLRPVRAPAAERAILVAIQRSGETGWEVEDSLEELTRLAETAGAQVVGVVTQQRKSPDPATFIGRGKVQDVLRMSDEREAHLVIFDDELTPAQQRNLEQELGLKVIDRTALVLDIFARRARTREGRLQVELAQLQYMLPRLAGRGVWLSRLGGGIGTRGPGETKLEVDRRHIRRRITDLKKEIEEISRHRRLHREARKEAVLPVVALVGYTNAGKSTLLNALTNANTFVEDKLFATLDPVVRKAVLPDGRPVLLVDTVGFIRKLPTQLVAAFRATLEEVVEATLLVHVVDAIHPRRLEQIQVVNEILEELGASEKPMVYALNKIDALPPRELQRLQMEIPDGVPISALYRRGLGDLLTRISERLPDRPERIYLRIPYAKARLLKEIRERGRVLTQEFKEEWIEVEAVVPPATANHLRASLRDEAH